MDAVYILSFIVLQVAAMSEFLSFEEALLVNTPTCQEPAPVANAYRYSIPGLVVYACLQGYQLASGNNSLTCLSNGTWSGQIPLCELTCGQPPLVSGATVISYTISNGVRFALYQCQSPLVSTGSQYIMMPCQEDLGYWMTPSPFCFNPNSPTVDIFHPSTITGVTTIPANSTSPPLVLSTSQARLLELNQSCLQVGVSGDTNEVILEFPFRNDTQPMEIISVVLRLESIDTSSECVLASPSPVQYGTSYVGTINITMSGLTCQPWADTTPHNHTYNDLGTTVFPDTDFSSVMNYCRNPKKGGSYRDRPWCFTTNSSTVWEFCNITVCPDFYMNVSIVDQTSGTSQTCGQTKFFTSSAVANITMKSPSSQTGIHGTHLRLSVSSSRSRNLFVCAITYNGTEYEDDCGEPHYERGWNLTRLTSYQTEAEALFVCARGYHYIQGDGSIVCLTSRQWSSPTLVCSADTNHAYTNIATEFPIQDNDVTTCSPSVANMTYTVTLDYTVEISRVVLIFLGVRPAVVTVSATIPGGHVRHCNNQTETLYGFLFSCSSYPITKILHITMVTPSSSSLCEVKAFGRKYDGVLECKQTELGMDYKGHLNIPIKGRTCYPWASLNQSWFADYEFPDGNITDVQNYCRNPRVKSTNQPAQLFRPFCYYYVESINLIGWDYCDLFSCEKGCRTTKMGTEYAGKINSTSPGSSPCGVWNRGSSYFKRKSDFSVQDSPKTNYCRNPAGSQARPWCYTNTTTLIYGYCDVPTCPTAESTIIMTFDLNMTSDRDAFRAQVSVFRECLATQWAQASYSPPIYDAVMYQLCSSSGVRKNLLCYYNNNTAVLDYGDTATWMRIYITCPTDPLTTTTAVSTPMSSQNTTVQLTTGQQTTDPVTATDVTSNVNITSGTTTSGTSEPNMCPTSCQVTCTSGMSSIELKVYIEEIRHELVLDKSVLSKTIRTKVSAPDERPSARATAGVAIAVTVVIIACLISSDAISLSVFIYSKVKGKSPAVQGMYA